MTAFPFPAGGEDCPVLPQVFHQMIIVLGLLVDQCFSFVRSSSVHGCVLNSFCWFSFFSLHFQMIEVLSPHLPYQKLNMGLIWMCTTFTFWQNIPSLFTQLTVGTLRFIDQINTQPDMPQVLLQDKKFYFKMIFLSESPNPILSKFGKPLLASSLTCPCRHQCVIRF